MLPLGNDSKTFIKRGVKNARFDNINCARNCWKVCKDQMPKAAEITNEWSQLEHQLSKRFHCLCIDNSLATAEELTAALSPAESHVILCDYEREAINALEIGGIFESHQFISLPDLEGSVYIRSLPCYCLACVDLNFAECFHRREVGDVQVRRILKTDLISQASLQPARLVPLMEFYKKRRKATSSK